MSLVSTVRSSFWRWTDFRSYVEFSLYFWISATLLTLVFIKSPLFVQALGGASVCIEASLGVPQMLQNHRTKKTAGISVPLIISWFLGDAFKTVYYVLRNQPLQFILCGITQLFIDIVILFQITLYKDKKEPHVSIPKDEEEA
eukprot:TRINITY_DN3346_c0_g1_i5.p2 TRINITY_DN3346_c0_g1~~TRINITY_DN3346_c0_g1_i5.p2  ORF type:complete len:143 (-),score=25.11 TRINITY_DN3346_c0_g1_i5:30-458(-)